MAKVINCDDGYVACGQTDDELVENALAHIRSNHPGPGRQGHPRVAMAVPA